MKELEPLSNLPYIIAIVIIALLFFLRPFSLTQFPARDHAIEYIPDIETTRQSAIDFNDPFPLWNPNRFSGSPFYGKGNYIGMDSALMGPLLLLTNSSIKATKLSYLIDVMLAGVFMYILLINMIV